MYSILQVIFKEGMNINTEPKPQKATGFASPAQGYEAKSIDLNAWLLKNPLATYVFRHESSEMTELGIYPGSLLLVDRSQKPHHGSFVIVVLEGQFLCRQLTLKDKKTAFTSGTTEISPAPGDYEIFGTVRAIVRELC
jgi:DNA polymerase V